VSRVQDAIQGVLSPSLAALPMVIIFITVLSFPLAAASELGLSSAEVAGWILAVYGIPGALGLALALYYRQPLLLTGNVFAIIFVASLGDDLGYDEIIGAAVVAGGIVLLIGALRMTDRLAAWLPAPIVFGLLAGAVLPFVAGIFTGIGESPVLVGSTLGAYLLGQRFFGSRLTPVLPALVVGILVAWILGDLETGSGDFTWLAPEITFPAFSLEALATVTPVFVILITVQSNLASEVYLRKQGFQPPERAINVVSGLGTMAGSLFGPTAVSIPLPAIPLAAGPSAGDLRVRHRSVYVAAGALIAIGLLAGIAAGLAAFIPRQLLLALAGVALLQVLASALQEAMRGPLLLGPLFAFAVAVSDISLLSLGPFFWALIFGAAISLLLERDEWQALRQEKSS
jgi:benzoate membrane transport protein